MHSTWLETRSRWSKLRELGQSRLVRASVLMPVFGYLLVLNENVHQYLTIQYDSGWPFNYLPSMWRLWMLYYGTLFLAMGSMLFAWRCPVVVKQYASALNLADAERHHRTAHNQTNEIARGLESLYEGMSKWENSIFALPRLKPDQPNLGVGTSPDLISSDLWGLGLIHIWTVNDIKQPTLRIIIYVLFRAGLALLVVPAVHVRAGHLSPCEASVYVRGVHLTRDVVLRRRIGRGRRCDVEIGAMRRKWSGRSMSALPG